MKKLLFILTAITSFTSAFGQQGQIQNGGFENWTNETIADTLVDWGDSNSDQQGPPTVFQSTDAAEGNYSAELSVAAFGPNMQDTIFGYIFHGSVGENGPEGGISYTADFDEVQYQYKADLAADDTLYLLLIRFTGGVPMGMELYPAASGQVNSWTQGSINVSTGTQDQLFIGFIVGDPFDNFEPSPNSTAWVDNVRMYNMGSSTTDLPDPSLENWNSVTVENPDFWFTLNELVTRSGLPQNVQKSTDVASGSFAAEMTVLYEPQNQDTIGAIVSLGPVLPGAMNPFIPAPYDAMPSEMTGSYKYAPANSDTDAGLLLEFYEGGSLSTTQYESFTANATYTNFTLPLSFSNAPDSVVLYAYAGDNPGSVLHLDDLSFNGGNVGVEEENVLQTLVYPNPANEAIYLRVDLNTKYQLIDVMGNTLDKGVTNSSISEFDITALQQGVYFFQITRNGESKTLKFIKK